MSGGSLDYVCYKLDDAIEVIERRATTVLQTAFAVHLKDVSKALHDLEWVFSGDYSDGDEVEALRKVVNKEMELDAATKQAGILFVPIPVLNEAQQAQLNKVLHDALMEIERQNSLCECKARDRKYCEGEWEQDCDLGKNEKFATPAPDA